MNIIEEIRTFRKIVLGKQNKLIPGDHIILDDDVISVDFDPVDALLDRLEEVEDDVNTLNFDVTELDIRLDVAEENIEDAQEHLDNVDHSINSLSESLDALETKVDNIHGFEIIALSEGQYDPETMKPTIENPKTNTLYLVPNADPHQSNLWIEWLWINDRWEQFGTAVIDLSEYVKKTDTPTAILPGVVKVDRLNGVQLLSNGQLAITPANLGDIKSGRNEYLPIAPAQQHNAVFYGLARASRTPALYYNAVDKTNIRLMIDAGSHAQVENLANDVEEFGIKVNQLLNRTGETRPGMVWESKLDGAGWSEAPQGRVVDVTKDGESLMDEYGIVELPAGEKEIFEATYGVTTYDEITEALEAGKLPIVYYNKFTYTFSYDNDVDASSESYEFQSVNAIMHRGIFVSKNDDSWHYVEIEMQQKNLVTTVSGYEASNTQYPSTKAVVDYIGNAGFMPKSQLLDAGIKSISWSTSRSEITVVTTEDIYKTQRPTGTNTRYWGEFEGCPYFKHSKLYRVTFNGTVYDNLNCRYGILTQYGASSAIGGAWQLIGNRALYDSRYEDTGEPFCILYVEHGGAKNTNPYYYSKTVGNGILLTSSSSSNTLKIETATITEVRLPANFRDNFGQGDESYETIGSSTYPRFSFGQGNIVNRGSFAIGNSNISTGQFALAVGKDNVASGADSYAEGYMSNATGQSSHCEGINYMSGAQEHLASGIGAHCEGINNQSTNLGSHAEGLLSSATQGAAHAEGIRSVASGQFSHAEGNTTTAAKNGSHSEGNGTYANTEYQHVQGTWNIKDISSKYAHIVGNGTADNARSNAHTLDWNGLGWFKGGLKVGGTGQDDSNAENVVLESDLSSYALESDLEALEDKVDALHGFEIVFLTTGEYDPTTGIPTILGPQEGTLYLVPSGESAPNLWIEWLWTGEAWEKFGSASIDLSNYVQKTDYATSAVGGVVKASMVKNVSVNGSGELIAGVMSYSDYALKSNDSFIGKGTLENVLAGRGYLTEVPTANDNSIGGFKTSGTFGTSVSQSNGKLYATVVNYSDYDTSDTNMFISKGTLNNVLTGRGYPVDVKVNGTSVVDGNKVANIPIPSISYDETEEMLIWQTTADDGNEVSY